MVAIFVVVGGTWVLIAVIKSYKSQSLGGGRTWTLQCSTAKVISLIGTDKLLQVTHSSGVVVSLQTKLVAMTKDFKRVLEVRTENMKESKSRQEKFSHGAITPTNLPIAVTNGYHKGSVLALSAMEDDLAVSQVPYFIFKNPSPRAME